MRVWTQNKRSPSQEMKILPVPKTFNLKERNGVIHIITYLLVLDTFPFNKRKEKRDLNKTMTQINDNRARDSSSLMSQNTPPNGGFGSACHSD